MNFSTYISKNHKTHLIFDLDETIAKLLLPWERCLEFVEDDLRKLDSKIINGFKTKTVSCSGLQNQYKIKVQ